MLNHITDATRARRCGSCARGGCTTWGGCSTSACPCSRGATSARRWSPPRTTRTRGGAGREPRQLDHRADRRHPAARHPPRRALPPADRRSRLQRLERRRARGHRGRQAARRRDGAADRDPRLARGRRAARPRRGDRRRRTSIRQPGDAVLFHTGWGEHWDDADTYLSGRARPRHGARRAGWCERGVALTGCDTWSYGPVPAEDPGAAVRGAPVPQRRATACSSSRTSTPSELARDGVREFALILTHPKLRGATRRVDLADRARLGGRLMEHYDVIIIGTGAGGGTLAHRLAPSGKRILLLERGGYLPREPENWDSEEVFGQRALRHHRALVSTSTASRSARTPSTSSAATPRSTAASCSACASATSTRSATTAASPPPGRSPTPISSRTTPRPSGSTSCTARPARTRPSRRARARSPTPPSRTSRGSSSCTTTSSRAGHRPFHLPVGIDLDESDPEAGRCMRCDRFDGFPCLTDGKADAHVLCVRPALKHPNVTLRTHALVKRLETDASGRSVTRVVVERRGSEETYSADIVVVSCGAVNSAALLLRSASDQHPNGLANSSDVVGRHYMAHLNSGVIAISRTPNDDQVPEDARPQRLLLGRRGLRAPARAHPDARQVRPRHPARRRALVRARARARLHGQARDRLLAHHRGPARSRQPRHGRPRRAASTSPRPTTTPSPTGGCWRSSRTCSGRSAATGAAIPRWSVLEPADPARRHRAQLRHRALRRPTPSARRSTSTARRTTSTTSTSSTRASSRRRAR